MSLIVDLTTGLDERAARYAERIDQKPPKAKIVVLLSGGMDSALVATMAKRTGKHIIALNLFYGQKHAVERQCARRIQRALNLDEYKELDLSATFTSFQSALLQSGSDIDDNQNPNEIGATYVPARNSIFLSIAAGFADSVGAEEVWYGAHRDDHAGYPDCRAEYFRAMQVALQEGTQNQIRIVAPLLELTKADIVEKGMLLGTPFQLTHSCYKGHRPACGTCPTCVLRIDAFKKTGITDPIAYAIDTRKTEKALASTDKLEPLEIRKSLCPTRGNTCNTNLSVKVADEAVAGVHRIAKSFAFDCAHMLRAHDGKCKNVHGHRYTMEVILESEELQSLGSSQGMILDLGDLSRIVKERIVEPFDHAFLTDITAPSDSAEARITKQLQKEGHKVVRMTAPTTVENLSRVFYALLLPHLPGLRAVKVWETPKSYAEFVREISKEGC